MSEKKTGGLAGVVAGKTAICTVGKQGLGLTYRGYSIADLPNGAHTLRHALEVGWQGVCAHVALHGRSGHRATDAIRSRQILGGSSRPGARPGQ